MISKSRGKTLSSVSTLVVLIGFGGGMVDGSFADEARRPAAIQVDEVNEQGALVLADGGELCLAGIWTPTAVGGLDHRVTWQSAWREIASDRGIFYRTDPSRKHDRYGCLLADVETMDGVSLQHALLAAGWAMVDPSSATIEESAIDAMLRLEDQARKAGRGIWKGSRAGPRKAEDLDHWIGTRQLVEGRVKRVSDNERYVYLNFGADWRTDFTARLKQKMLASAGIDASGFDGRKVRVRGVLQDSRGPLIDITHPKQIEFLP